MTRDVLDDYPDDLVPIPATRECDKCDAYTWWAGPRQRTKGRCISCAKKWQASEELHDKTMWIIAGAFPGTNTIDLGRPKLWAAGVYTGDGAGPCALCRGQIKRYGEGAMPLCAECDRVRGGSDGRQ